MPRALQLTPSSWPKVKVYPTESGQSTRPVEDAEVQGVSLFVSDAFLLLFVVLLAGCEEVLETIVETSSPYFAVTAGIDSVVNDWLRVQARQLTSAGERTKLNRLAEESILFSNMAIMFQAVCAAVVTVLLFHTATHWDAFPVGLRSK
jgi:predicted membrane protein